MSSARPGATSVPAGGAGTDVYGSQQQQVVQRSHEQQTPDHRKEDHQRWLGKGEEAPARLVLRRRGLALLRVQHLAADDGAPDGPSAINAHGSWGVRRIP